MKRFAFLFCGFLLILSGCRSNPDQKLIYALAEGNPEAIKAAVLSGAKVNVILTESKGKWREEVIAYWGPSGPSGRTPLNTQVEAGRVDNARALIEAGADPNFRDGFGATPLHYAISKRHLSIMEMLLKAKADPNASIDGARASELPDHDALSGDTPLILAVKSGLPRDVETLIKYGAKVDQRDLDGRTAFWHAEQMLHLNDGKSVKERLHQINGLLLKVGADPAPRDKAGKTPGKVPTRADAIEEPNSMPGPQRKLSHDAAILQVELYRAIKAGNIKSVKQTLKRGAQVNTGFWEVPGHGEFHKAIEMAHYNLTPLMMALERNDLRIANILLKAGADIEEPDSDWSPLMKVASNARVASVAMLLKKGANPNRIGFGSGETALMHATMRRSLPCVKLLLKYGADPDLRDYHDRTALWYISFPDDEKTIGKLIRQASAARKKKRAAQNVKAGIEKKTQTSKP